ncbi:hypothetical protein CO662_24940 [Rhizobium anhuiense]|uniref:Cyclic nucleotide-binding domain-containing protein n=1 Tax=Rhizobium anhuiense TaxID=1184720 RepID=A0ABX4J312_9HYPH|nr:hypothetical protein [Rhizobium anhuiense]PDS45213.1 hypothetical protein CO668_08890 [Rhizobium anhuiense]PDS49192.1 hypothetical protein CO662_24940 [Rhizobium anhuiense]
MWNLDSLPDGNLDRQVIVPVDTLYEYDGPMIFRTRIGLVDLLCNKVSRRNGLDIILACQTDDRTITALKDGKLSVHGAFAREAYWIISLDDEDRIAAYWNCRRVDLPDRFFAKPGLGLFHWFGTVPDSLEQTSALLAIKFRGEALTEAGMPFGKLKGLLDQAFETARKILIPPQLANTKSSTFDLEVAPLRFASLMIAVKEPVINMQAIRRNRTLDKYERADFELAVRNRGADFATRLQDVYRTTQNNQLDDRYAEENFAFLDVLADILPDEQSFIDSVEFNAASTHGLTTVVFRKDEASAIKAKVQGADARRVVEHGSVTGITVASKSLRIRSVRQKDVTCYLTADHFAELLAERESILNRAIELRGTLTRRQRRDLLQVDQYRLIDRDILL